jgi:hypothetical protein
MASNAGWRYEVRTSGLAFRPGVAQLLPLSSIVRSANIQVSAETS